MTHLDIVKGIGGLLFTAGTLIFFIFFNFLLRRGSGQIFGVPIPVKMVHAVLGPVLVLINSALLVLLSALYKTSLNEAAISEIKTLQIKWFLGPFLNPFYIGGHSALNTLGYAFLIILWWIGMHSLVYSINLNPESRWLFGWQSLISVLFLALGLASMLAIQGCWQKWGEAAFRIKWAAGFIGIPIGAFLPPLFLKLGLPSIR